MSRSIVANLISSLFVLVFHSSLVAQVWIELPPMTIKPANRTFYIKEVVDARLNPMSIGFIPHGLRESELAMMKPGLASYLQTYLDQSLPSIPHAYSLLMRINRFGIASDKEGNKMVARLDADFTFFLSKGQGFQEIFSQQYHLKSPGAWEKGTHEALILSALSASLTSLANGDWEKKLASLPMTDYSQITETNIPPILAAEKPNVGVYRTFEEFRNDAPFITNLHWKVKNREAHCIDNQGKEVNVTTKDLYWGFSDGEKLYLIQGDSYVELRRSNRGIHYLGTNRSRAFKKTVKGAIGAGVIGAAIWGGTTAKNGLYIIDLETGDHLYAR